MARIANLAMMEFAIIRAFPFPHSTAAFALREKNGAATSFQSFCKYFAGAFYCRLCAWQDMFEAFRQGKNRSKSRFIFRGRRKKFPNANPKAESSPNHFDFPVISYYFPPFSVSKLLGNVGRQITRACPSRGSVGIFPAPPVFLRRRRKFFFRRGKVFVARLAH